MKIQSHLLLITTMGLLSLVYALQFSAKAAQSSEQICLNTQKPSEDSLSHCNTALDEYPENGLLWFRRASIYLLQDKYTDAISDFNQAIELNPEDQMVLLARGLAYYANGEMHLAEIDFKQAQNVVSLPNNTMTNERMQSVMRDLQLAKTSDRIALIRFYEGMIQLLKDWQTQHPASAL